MTRHLFLVLFACLPSAAIAQKSATPIEGIPFPIPPGATGVKLYRQWVELQSSKTNPAGIVLSNARMIEVK